jgi:predicted SAM-dependent methyltransferase
MARTLLAARGGLALGKMIVRGSLTLGLKRAVRNIISEAACAAKHGMGVKAAGRYQGQSNLKLNIGCGSNVRTGWVNIDLSPEVDLMLDLREKLPFRDGSCDFIYSEHFFEHLEYPEDATRFLAESFRLLRSGGIFSVGVPDTKWPLLAYADAAHGYFESAEALQSHPHWCKTQLDHINYHFRQDGEHRYAYDFETLQSALEITGFVNVHQREFDPAIDSEKRRIGSLYVNALKA